MDSLKRASDWRYLIVISGGLGDGAGRLLPDYIGPFNTVADAESWGESNIVGDSWIITDLAELAPTP